VAVVTLVFSGQAVFYVARERERLWSSVPGKWLIMSSAMDLTFIGIVAINFVLMDAVPFVVVMGLLDAAMVLALALDSIKQVLFHRLTAA
jgi:H+-transporting ATPase